MTQLVMTHVVRLLTGSALAGLALAAPGVAAAQGAPAPTKGPVTIESGMSRDQVIARLGTPIAERHDGAMTWLRFDNDCGRACGGDDLVTLDGDAVVDAVFRTGRRVYAGARPPTTLSSVVASQRPTPDPIRPASAADSAHRGGIVFMGPRPPAAPPRYDVMKPRIDTSTKSDTSGGRPGTGHTPR
jgi:hypothetical protein